MRNLVFSTIQRETVWSAVADQLRSLILDGTLPPGSRLPSERELCRQLGVSRVSLREALRALQYAGYLRIVPGRGTFVRDAPDLAQHSLQESFHSHGNVVKEIKEIFEVRQIVEPGVARIAALRASPEQLVALRNTIQEMQHAAAAGDLDAAIAADAEFHYHVARVTGNELIIRLVCQLLRSTGQERRASLRVPGQLDRAIAGHTAIWEAIQKHRPDEAAAQMEQHLRDAWRYIQAWVAGQLDPISGRLREKGEEDQ